MRNNIFNWMKLSSFIFALSALFASCSNELDDTLQPVENGTLQFVVGDFPAFGEDPQTRASSFGTPDEGKTAWANEDKILVHLYSQKYGDQAATLTFDAENNTWESDGGTLSYLENETPTITAVYAPDCEIKSDKTIGLLEGKQYGEAEYILARTTISENSLDINFESGRTYSRLRIVAEAGQLLVVTTTGFTPAGATEEAIEAFQFSIACDESYTMAHFMLGQAYFIDRQFEKAIKHLSETLEDELYNHSAYRYFGDYELLCGRYDEALRYYRQSLDLSSSEFALCGIIKTLTAMGKSDEAEPFVNQLISETFITPDAFPDVCSILIDKGKRDLIPTIIDRTLTGYTHYRNFFEDLFDFFLTKKEYQLGLDIFEIYLRLMDEHRIADDYYYYCAALNFLLNRIETGITFLHDALLFNFEKHQEFLSWDPSFAENEKIIDLIQKYKN